ncbi:substrate-binding periplasmic protein [Pseudoalteromonas luteoviolacea]|uniref:substrate-binding periplasmic protein n=1 Tax=Pseudoalteromonas luteoviolacea TaxID=43657 RepID=UPI001B38C1AD|nr:hypothetical protein [Pseudoalteromonas luteoviolacea]MBQ4835222.1 hypothetical protein [Pseudoalteromonas luteoviolacea]
MRLAKRWVWACVLPFFMSINECLANKARIYLDEEDELKVFTSLTAPSNIAGATNKLLFDVLDNDSIEFALSSYNRALREMQSNTQAICTINRIKTAEREASFLFSLPVNFYVSRRLYQHASARKLANAVLNPNGEIRSLQSLFKVYSSKLIALSDNMSYGPFLDDQLKQVDSSNKVIRSGSEQYETIYRMFRLQRVDYLLGYPAEVFRHVKNDGASYRSYKIAGTPTFILGHVMCNKTSNSQALIKAINKAMRKIYKTQSFVAAHLNFLPPSEHKITQSIIEKYKYELDEKQ